MFGCTFSVEKVGPNKLRCPAKGKPSHTPNGSSPMCNQLYRTRPDDSLAAQAHILAPMELEHRPREA